MKTIKGIKFHLLLTACILMIATVSCNKEEEMPVLSTMTVTRLTDNSAICGGEISSDGGNEISECGVCWCNNPAPTTANNKSVTTAISGCFESSITGLLPNTTYHIRAYATNSAGTSYGGDIMFTTPPTLTDIDGNVYHTVVVGTQVWMAENLRVTHYRNGDEIEPVDNSMVWSRITTPAYCMYSNSSVYSDIYGMLYNGHAVLDSRNIAPAGWHVASDAEWKKLEGAVDSQYPEGDPEWDKTQYRGSNAGGNLKAHADNWTQPNAGATDKSGFSALPGGFRSGIDGSYADLNNATYIWTSTPYNEFSNWVRQVNYDQTGILRFGANKSFGGSVRCVKD